MSAISPRWAAVAAAASWALSASASCAACDLGEQGVGAVEVAVFERRLGLLLQRGDLGALRWGRLDLGE